MKRIFLIAFTAIIASLSAVASNNGAAITFAETTYDLGTIKANKGNVTATYQFTNTGTEPLIIISVTNGGCGCTNPSYPKAPIAPGKSGEIKIKFDPSGRRGEFSRQVKVKTNAQNKRISLKFSGVIIPD